MNEQLTTGQVARTISESPIIPGAAREWQIRRLFEDGTLPEPPKFGGKRVTQPSLLPDIIAAMRRRGWLPSEKCSEGSSILTAHTEDTEREQ